MKIQRKKLVLNIFGNSEIIYLSAKVFYQNLILTYNVNKAFYIFWNDLINYYFVKLNRSDGLKKPFLLNFYSLALGIGNKRLALPILRVRSTLIMS